MAWLESVVTPPGPKKTVGLGVSDHGAANGDCGAAGSINWLTSILSGGTSVSCPFTNFGLGTMYNAARLHVSGPWVAVFPRSSTAIAWTEDTSKHVTTGNAFFMSRFFRNGNLLRNPVCGFPRKYAKQARLETTGLGLPVRYVTSKTHT